VPEQSLLDVLGTQRLTQEGIRPQVDHPDGEVVAGAPVRIDPAQLLGGDSSRARRRPLSTLQLLHVGSLRNGIAAVRAV
jgi:hypothetical protein